jgi:flagellar protein FliS
VSEDQRQRYLADAVNTASPAQLVVMLYDRLGLDIERAASAQESDEYFASTEHLRHGQRVLAELMSSLNVEAWEGGGDLSALYGFLLRELIAVCGAADAPRLRQAGEMVSGLRASWYAAAQLVQGDAPSAGPADRAPASAGAWVG